MGFQASCLDCRRSRLIAGSGFRADDIDGVVDVVIEMEDFGKPSDLERTPNKWSCGYEMEFPSVELPHSAHGIYQHPECGTVEVGNMRQIDDDIVVLVIDQLAQRVSEPATRMQIYLALEMDDGNVVAGYC